MWLVVYRMAPLRVAVSDHEGHFCCLKLLCPSATMVRVHCCAGGIIRGDVYNTGGSRRSLITVTVQLTSPRLVVWKSVDNTHGIACSLCDSCA